MSNWYYCVIMNNYVFVLIYNLCITLFFIFCSLSLQNHVLVKISYIYQSLSPEEWTLIVTLSNLKFSVHQITKKMKISKTAVHNAIMKSQNEGVFVEKGLADLGLPPAESR